MLAGPLVNILLAFALVVGSLMVVGVQVNVNSNTLGGVADGSPAEAAGLRGGDTILQVGGRDVSDWKGLCEALDRALEGGQDFPIAYQRDGETFETTIDVPEGERLSVIGINALMETYRLSFPEAALSALSYVGFVGGMVARIIMPQHTIEVVSQSSSIVGISAMASQAAASGLSDLVLLTAAISLSLGFMNLLPIPPLDGGKILMEAVQLVWRRPLPSRAQAWLSYLGLAFFLFIFCFAIRNDIVRLMGLT